jgi:O-antigen/teichoic acid export membrane protein
MEEAIPKKPVPSNGSSNVRVNVVINLIRTLTLTILSFITFPYVCRILGDSTLGLYTWVNTFVYYFLILAKISIPNIAIRECVKVRDDKKAFSHKVQEFFLLQAFMTILSFGLMVSIMAAVPAFNDQTYMQLGFLLSINFLAGVFSFEWVYIALEKHFYIAVRSIATLALSAILTFVYVTRQGDYSDKDTQRVLFVYASITILSTILTSLINCLVLPKYVSFKKEGPYDFRSMLKPLIVLFFISFALTLYNETDVLLLGFLDSTKAAVGTYSVGVKGIDIIITIITSLYAVFMPRASFYYQKDDKQYFKNLIRYSMNITFFIAIPAIATMTTMAKPITALISGSYVNNQYQDAYLVLIILSIMMLTYSIGDNIYTEILLPSKRETIYLYTMLIGVVLNVGLSLLFALVIMPAHQTLGVAIATGVTDVLILIFLIYETREYSLKAIFNLNNLKIVLFGGAIALITYFLAPYLLSYLPWKDAEIWKSYVLELVIMVAGDAIIYIGGLAIAREKLVSSFSAKHRKEMEEKNNG